MRYDTTLKTLLRAQPPRLLELLTGAARLKILTIEYPATRSRRADLVFARPDGEIHQFELQSGNEADMDYRMLEYYPLLCREYGRPPLQTVLYVGNAPLTMRGGLEHPHLSYRYEVLDVRTFKAAPLLASDSLDDNLLALLCGDGTTPTVIRRILRRIARLPERARQDRLIQLFILSGLRQAEPVIKREVKKMSFEMDIMENSFLRGIYLDGEKQGKEEGKAEGKEVGRQEMLRLLLEERFGKLPKWAQKRLQAADPATLLRWGKRLLHAQRLEEVVPRPPARTAH